jgi:mercuric ion transport protein
MAESVRAFLRREMTRQNKAGAILAVLTCPCHTVMILFLLAGTTVGSVLAAFRAYLYLTFTLLFLFGLWLMVRRATGPCDTDACRLPSERSENAQQEHERV